MNENIPAVFVDIFKAFGMIASEDKDKGNTNEKEI